MSELRPTGVETGGALPLQGVHLMSIRKDKSGEFEARCDEEGCKERTYGGCEDKFLAFVQFLKDEGWRISRNSAGEYEHACPSCAEE